MTTLKKDPNFRVKVFAYRGYFGINMQCDLDKEADVWTVPEGVLNDPLAPGQMGIVVDPKSVDFSTAALYDLKRAKREGGSFAPVMCDTGSFGWMGGAKFASPVKELSIGRTCNPNHFHEAAEKVEIPQDFKDYVDSLLDKEE